MNQPLRLVKVVQSRGEAIGLLKVPGDAVLIERGRPRWLLLACPCGCGDEIPINLDRRAAAAWRIYRNDKQGLSLYPSVWRDTGCESHFIIWRGQINLFRRWIPEDQWSGSQETLLVLSDGILRTMPKSGYASLVELADKLEEVPWDVLDACRHLVRKGILIEGTGKQRSTFCRV